MDFQKEWQKFIQELPGLSKIHIPRYIIWGLHSYTFFETHLRMPIGKDAFYAELVLAKCKAAPIMPQLSILKIDKTVQVS